MHFLCRLARGQLGFGGQPLLDRQRGVPRPFVPGAEIHPHVLYAGIFERQEGVRCPRALEAIEVDRGILRDADGCAFGENLVLGLRICQPPTAWFWRRSESCWRRERRRTKRASASARPW